MVSRQTHSRILAEMHAAAPGLHRVGALDAPAMREMDALCLAPVPAYTASQVRRIRRAAGRAKRRLPRC